jgi:hypothetical protein
MPEPDGLGGVSWSNVGRPLDATAGHLAVSGELVWVNGGVMCEHAPSVTIPTPSESAMLTIRCIFQRPFSVTR